MLVLNDKPDLDGLLSKLALLDDEVKARLHLCSECSGQYDQGWRTWVDGKGTFVKGLSCFAHALADPRETSPRTTPTVQARGQLMSDVAAQRLLADAGIPTLELVEVWTIEGLEATISALKLPLVLKLAGSEHRSSEGVVTVTSRPRARAEFERLEQLGDVVAQAFAQPGLEFYVGVNMDPVFGAVFLIGAGGPILEEQQDVSVRIGLPDRAAIVDCFKETRCGRWLASSLGSHLLDIGALVDVARKAVALAEAMSDSLVALDLNPVVLGPGGATVVDAKVHLREVARHNLRGAV